MILAVNRITFGSFSKVTPRITSIAALFSQPSYRKMSSQSIEEKFQFPKRYQGSTPSVWYVYFLTDSVILLASTAFSWSFCFVCNRNEYIKLAMTYQPLNLGQGFADYPVPKYITDALSATANNPNCLLNQYTRGFVSNLMT